VSEIELCQYRWGAVRGYFFPTEEVWGRGVKRGRFPPSPETFDILMLKWRIFVTLWC